MQWLQRKISKGEDEDEDEDASENDENDEFDLSTDQEIPLVVEQ